MCKYVFRDMFNQFKMQFTDRQAPEWEQQARDEQERMAAEPDLADGPDIVKDVAHDESVGANEARRNLVGMHTPGRGFVKHEYTVRGILLCLSFAFCLKPSVSLQECLANACELFLFLPRGRV